MEFELERTGWNGCQRLLDTTLRTEETMEMIVPDSCPDILRVCETDGQVLVTGKEAENGRVQVSGCIKLWVLYLPDGESGVRRLEVTIPFACARDVADVTGECRVVASARLICADTRALNPRKILVRAEAAVDLGVYCPKTEQVCSRASAAGEGEVEQLTEQREIYPILLVQERTFPFSGDVTLPGSRPAAVELLKSRVDLIGGETRIIGNKLIYKGGARVFLLCRGEGGEAYPFAAELPFSQIMEVSGVTEGADVDMTAALSGAECSLNAGDDGRTVTVELQITAQAVVREERTVELLTDAYSTLCPVEVEMATIPVDTRVERGVRTQNVREVWETPEPVREVVDCRLDLGEMTASREGSQLTLTAQGRVGLLYANEEGALNSLQWPVSVPCVLELPEGCQCVCRCAVPGEVYASAAAGGVEVRFAMDFRYSATAILPLTAVTALREGEAPEEEGERPSLILRSLGQGERLWDMAKSCGTTVADIIRANELESESDGMGRLLLIPRRR